MSHSDKYAVRCVTTFNSADGVPLNPRAFRFLSKFRKLRRYRVHVRKYCARVVGYEADIRDYRFFFPKT